MAVSFKGSDGWIGGLPQGAPIQVAVGYQSASATRVFPSRSTYEEVPGGLRCTLTPTNANNQVVVKAHFAWGGWNTTTADVGAGFRILKKFGTSQTWINHGSYFPDIPTTVNVPSGVATGVYKYAQGDTNSSFDSDDILIVGPAGSTQPITFALHWCCLYEAGSRTLYWNRSINSGNSYNPTHTCTITAMELKDF